MADILISGAVKPTTTDTPTDARTRVQTFADIENIENPYVGMDVYVIDEATKYTIHKLKSKFIGNIEIPDAAVDIDGVKPEDDPDEEWDEL